MDGDSNKQLTEHTPCKFSRYGSEYHLIAKCPKPPKYNNKQWKQVRFSERGNRVLQKELDNGDNDNDQKIYLYMAQVSGNDEIPSRYFGDSLQLTNLFLG